MSKQQPKQAATGASSEIAALRKTIANQERTIAVQGVQLEVAGKQLHYLATVAGVASEFGAIKREGARKIADIMNPAQPVPDPPSSGPTETTEEAATPETYDDPRNQGITPGSVGGVPAQATDSPLRPGVTLPTQPFTELVDVTQPVAGTETHVPLNQTRIDTDVRVGSPDDPTPAFPLTGPFAQEGAAASGSQPVGPVGMGRTMASIRLARLRKAAGLDSRDDLVIGAEIEKNAALSDQMIVHEIGTLEGVSKAASRRQAPATKQAAAERRVPSLAAVAGGGGLPPTMAAVGGPDLSDALFFDDLIAE
jgi:hypothetical protein